MTKTLPLWAALLFGVICGAVIGTIVAAFYLTLALKTGFQSFDMLACAFRASRTAIPTVRGQSFRGARTKFARDAERLI